MSFDINTYQPLANLSLWFKIKAGDSLTLADIPKIIPLRWPYFRDNYSFIKKQLEPFIEKYSDPDQLQQQIEALEDFILEQKSSAFKNVNPFLDKSTFYRFYSVFDNLLIDALPISEEERRVIDEVTTDVLSFNRNTFLELRKQITEVRDIIADQAGLSDDTYNGIKRRVSVSRAISPDFSVLSQLKEMQDAIKSVDYILANEFGGAASAVDPFAVARANLEGTGVTIGTYGAGYMVPFNYGDTLERIAYRYLSDADRWMDIAIANGLKPPYVDEVGFAMNMVADGYKNTVAIEGVTGTEENIKRLYLNQAVFLSSDTLKFPEQRTIIGIRSIDANSLVLELSGDSDLEKFTLDDEAKVRAFKADTINSNFFIMIPTAGEADESNAKVTRIIQDLSADEKRAKIDIALNDDGDIQFTSTGDIKLSYGIANALQALKLKLSVELGALKRHPNFGLLNVLGQPGSDAPSTIAAMSQHIDEQVRADPRFERVEDLSVFYTTNKDEPAAVQVQLKVRMAGSGAILPIVFKVSNS